MKSKLFNKLSLAISLAILMLASLLLGVYFIVRPQTANADENDPQTQITIALNGRAGKVKVIPGETYTLTITVHSTAKDENGVLYDWASLTIPVGPVEATQVSGGETTTVQKEGTAQTFLTDVGQYFELVGDVTYLPAKINEQMSDDLGESYFNKKTGEAAGGLKTGFVINPQKLEDAVSTSDDVVISAQIKIKEEIATLDSDGAVTSGYSSFKLDALTRDNRLATHTYGMLNIHNQYMDQGPQIFLPHENRKANYEAYELMASTPLEVEVTNTLNTDAELNRLIIGHTDNFETDTTNGLPAGQAAEYLSAWEKKAVSGDEDAAIEWFVAGGSQVTGGLTYKSDNKNLKNFAVNPTASDGASIWVWLKGAEITEDNRMADGFTKVTDRDFYVNASGEIGYFDETIESVTKTYVAQGAIEILGNNATNTIDNFDYNTNYEMLELLPGANTLYLEVLAEDGTTWGEEITTVAITMAYARLSQLELGYKSDTFGGDQTNLLVGVIPSEDPDGEDTEVGKDEFTFNVDLPEDAVIKYDRETEGEGDNVIVTYVPVAVPVNITSVVSEGHGEDEDINVEHSEDLTVDVDSGLTPFTIKFSEDEGKWENQNVKLTVTASNGDTKEYTINFTVKSVDTDAMIYLKQQLSDTTKLAAKRKTETVTEPGEGGADTEVGKEYYQITIYGNSVTGGFLTAETHEKATWKAYNGETELTVTDSYTEHVALGSYTITVTAEAGNKKDYDVRIFQCLALPLSEDATADFIYEVRIDEEGYGDVTASYRKNYKDNENADGELWTHGVDDIDFTDEYVLGKIMPMQSILDVLGANFDEDTLSKIVLKGYNAGKVMTFYEYGEASQELKDFCDDEGEDLDEVLQYSDTFAVGTGWWIEYGPQDLDTTTTVKDIVYISVLGDINGDGMLSSQDSSVFPRVIRRVVDFWSYSVAERLAFYMGNRTTYISGNDLSSEYNTIRQVGQGRFNFYTTAFRTTSIYDPYLDEEDEEGMGLYGKPRPIV